MDSKISMTKMKVSFLGLGVMGYPMAGHLVSAGFDVTVFNRTTQKAKQWVEKYGAKLALSPSEAAKDADVVLMCVGDDNDVRTVAKEAIAAMNEGTLLIDHTTASATVAKEIDRVCKDHGLGFLDAPVSGGGLLVGRCRASTTIAPQASPTTTVSTHSSTTAASRRWTCAS